MSGEMTAGGAPTAADGMSFGVDGPTAASQHCHCPALSTHGRRRVNDGCDE